LADPEAVLESARGCDVVVHAGAKAGVWGPYEQYYRTNVLGTENVLDACRSNGVRRLVYTSSPSVVFDGTDMEGVDESAPYPDVYEAAYPETKAMAERMVLGADDEDLATVSLRPHLIWGPGDNHLVPRIVKRRKEGALRKLSGPVKKVDSVYIDNAVDAHLSAVDRLVPGSALSGKAYFISNGEPMPLWELVDGILRAAGLAPVERAVHPRLACLAGAILETACRILDLPGEPRMTRFLARELATSHWFDLTAAKRDLGYAPKVSIAEGLERLRAYFSRS